MCKRFYCVNASIIGPSIGNHRCLKNVFDEYVDTADVLESPHLI